MKSEIEVENTTCTVCMTSESEPIYTVVEHEYPDTTADEFHIHRCLNCGLWFLNPRPAISELGTIYPPNYYAFSLAEKGVESRQLNGKKISDFFEASRIKKIIRTHMKYLPKSVLDVGCGDGTDLDLFRKLFGNGLQTFGIEPSESAAMLAIRRGHKVEVGMFPAPYFRSKHFDVIWSKHVIEHVADPREFLVVSRELLNEDGIIVLDTPNTDSPLRKLFGRHWGGWHTPRHWYLFDPATITELARQCELSVVKIYQMPINTFWTWSIHSLLFRRYRAFADRFFNPSKVATSGRATLALLICFQFLELALKALFRKTSQMRIVLRHATN
jgi:2-polyprenyl-3-methyl-5-hydroxy-6-metoxy-1,4-benzoquinol methylase